MAVKKKINTDIDKIVCACQIHDNCKRTNGLQNKKNYYISSSRIFSGIGVLPVCKDCLGILFGEYVTKYESEQMAMYKLCERFDMPFTTSAFNGAKAHSEKTGWLLYQSYFKELNSLGGANGYGTCFDNGERIENKLDDIEDFTLNNGDFDEELKIFWGYGLDTKDYLFLETELAGWKQTHKCDNRAELILLKEICMKILEIRKQREIGGNVSKEQKELQELMKTASVDPAKANAISSGQSVDRFGVWIKDIEQYKPAEWWEEQEKYKDMDGFIPYIKNYIVRPIKNFFTGVKDFIINGEDLSFKENKEDLKDE
jgi:hypothetical protein